MQKNIEILINSAQNFNADSPPFAIINQKAKEISKAIIKNLKLKVFSGEFIKNRKNIILIIKHDKVNLKRISSLTPKII